ADYLRAIFASIIREPHQPTPYLFLFGPEDSGKSIFTEAFSLLVTKGVVKADRVFNSKNEFNGELVGCILAVIEERDTLSAEALARLKDYTTSLTISIRPMYRQAYQIANTTHWVQCA